MTAHLDVTDLTTTTTLLTHWAQAHCGPTATVDRVAPMPGHAGISFGFDVRSESAVERLVIRVAPPGVRRSGPADVLRQVPVLQAAAASGVPVAPVRWWSADERWFGSPYFVVDRLRGSSLSCWEPQGETTHDTRSIFGAAIDALAAIHRIDWRCHLSAWAEPRSLEAEIRAWEPILGKGRNEAWSASGLALQEALLRTRPAEPELGVVHGDFYSNNWVCEDGKLLGVVDWEIAAIGPPLLDVGWLMMIYDPACWGPTRRPWMTWSPAPDELGEAYRAATGDPVPDLTWYQALACWRFAAITSMNLYLHRSGKRPDATWELIGEAFEPMVARGLELARV